MGKVEGDPPEGSAPPIGRELAPLVDLPRRTSRSGGWVGAKIVRGPSHRRPQPGDDREASSIAIGHVDLS